MRTGQAYSRMLFYFSGTLGKPPYQVTGLEFFNYARGNGLSGKKPSSVTRGALSLPSAASPARPNCRKFASAAPIHSNIRGPMLNYGDGTPTTGNTLLEIIDALKYELADQNIRIALFDHLLGRAAGSSGPSLVAVLVTLK